MGRYYGTNRFDGKFGFGVQPSTDPGDVFGMERIEDEPNETEASYWLDGDEENIERIRGILEGFYDDLGISEDDRIFKLKDGSDIWNMFEKYEAKHFRPFMKGKDKGIPYYSKFHEEGVVEITPGIQLTRCRVDLGVKILTELIESGECSLWAELV